MTDQFVAGHTFWCNTRSHRQCGGRVVTIDRAPTPCMCTCHAFAKDSGEPAWASPEALAIPTAVVN